MLLLLLQNITYRCLLSVGCSAGFQFVSDITCTRCPADTYQEKQGQKKCNRCPEKKQTFGKTGMTSKSNCSGTVTINLTVFDIKFTCKGAQLKKIIEISFFFFEKE